MMTPVVNEMDYPALQSLMARVEQAIEHNLALDTEDMCLLLSAIHTLMNLQSQLSEKDITLHKLRKLLGMVQSSERRSSPLSSKGNSKKGSSSQKKSKPRKKPTPSDTVHHTLTDVKKGDTCPACLKGTLKKATPKTLLRISGGEPLSAVQHVMERVQCPLCDYTETASVPDEVTRDGDLNQQYGYSARSAMAIYKHFSGIPYFHQETLNDLFGCPVSASTIFDQCEWAANDAIPVYYGLQKTAAQAPIFYIDDTHNRIIEQAPEERPKRNGKGTQLRSGVYTSGLIAMTDDGHPIHLYDTSLGHAGEHLDQILRHRHPGLPPPIIMSDALSCNRPTEIEDYIVALCNAHARRQFKDIETHFPEVGEVLDLYGDIWSEDHASQDKGHTLEERLTHHQMHSLPKMESIKAWCEDYQQTERYEEHSGLGKAVKYYLKHYAGLTQFCKVVGAPIDNNRMEEGLKTKIRCRKTSHFYKTQNGAGVANVLTSVITTAYRNGANAFNYLNALQRNRHEVKANPTAWLPWMPWQASDTEMGE